VTQVDFKLAAIRWRHKQTLWPQYICQVCGEDATGSTGRQLRRFQGPRLDNPTTARRMFFLMNCDAD